MATEELQAAWQALKESNNDAITALNTKDLGVETGEDLAIWLDERDRRTAIFDLVKHTGRSEVHVLRNYSSLLNAFYKSASVRASGDGEVASSSLEQMKSMLREAVEDVRRESQALPRAKSFSTANASDATKLLLELDLGEVDGNTDAPVELPPGIPLCDEFDFSNYSSENAGTAALLMHHRSQLENFKVHFGRGGYEMYNLHSVPRLYMYTSPSGQRFSGNVDGCIAPFGFFAETAATHAPVVYEHKQSEAQKQQYADAHPGEKGRQAEGTTTPVSFMSHKGQVVTALIGAYAFNHSPVMLDLTDGVLHTLLLLSNRELIVWTNLSPTEAYFKQAEHLKQLSSWLGDEPGRISKSKRMFQLESIPEGARNALQQIRSAVRGESALLEQLESIVPQVPASESVACALDIIASWQRTVEPMPDSALNMYS